VEGNHVGLKNHVAWFKMPFCSRKCHARFHVLAQQAGIDPSYTDDPIERIEQGLRAIKIAEWMLLDALKVERERLKHPLEGKQCQLTNRKQSFM
jgi:hypothetical protein